MEVFFVTGHTDFDNPYDEPRTFGFFETLEEAKDSVWGEGFLISEEGYYQYATIENAAPGLHSWLYAKRTTIFYKWDEDKEKYVEIEQPESTRSYAAFNCVG